MLSDTANLVPLVLAALVLCAGTGIASAAKEDKDSNGKAKTNVEDWNNEGISWLAEEDHGWEDSVTKATAEGKPILLLVHRTWCGACKQLRPNFAKSKDIEALSGDFVMLKSAGEVADFDHERFKPDGGYFPRILFFDSRGELMEGVVQREDKYKYFHFGAESIVKSMKEAIQINAERISAGGDGDQQVQNGEDNEGAKEEL